MTRALGSTALAALVASLALDLGCADAATPGWRDGGPGAPFDAGDRGLGDVTLPPGIDGSATDGPLAPMSTEVPTGALDDADYARACLDGVDADGFGDLDCADAECSAAPSCCVGATRATCCTASGPLFTLDFAGCTDLTSCGAASTVVGAPTLGSGLVVTVADGATADSGVLSSTAVDLRSGHVTLVATIVAPAADPSTIDAVAIGLYDAEAGGARSLPVAAMQLSASRGEVGIAIGDVVVASAPLGPGTADFTLTLTPTGEVTVTGPGVDLAAEIAVPPSLLRVGVLGRSESSTASPVRVEAVAVSRAACDVPAALVPAALSIEDRTGLYDPSSVAGPSFVADVSPRVLAFDAELRADGRRAIFVAVEDAGRPGTFVVEAAAGRPEPVLASSLALDEVSQPALAWTGTHWTLYATGLANGRLGIVRTTSADASFVFGLPTVLEAPPAEQLDGLSPERDGPAIIPGLPSTIVAREHTSEGPALVLLDVSGATAEYSGGVCDADSLDCSADPTARRSETVLTPRLGTFAPDADEVASPSVAVHRGVYRLYYAGRRGLRWSIGVAVSADARYWRRPASGDLVLSPTGAGPAALGASDPDVTIDGGGAVEVFYTAWNGIDTTLARATQHIR